MRQIEPVASRAPYMVSMWLLVSLRSPLVGLHARVPCLPCLEPSMHGLACSRASLSALNPKNPEP